MKQIKIHIASFVLQSKSTCSTMCFTLCSTSNHKSNIHKYDFSFFSLRSFFLFASFLRLMRFQSLTPFDGVSATSILAHVPMYVLLRYTLTQTHIHIWSRNIDRWVSMSMIFNFSVHFYFWLIFFHRFISEMLRCLSLRMCVPPFILAVCDCVCSREKERTVYKYVKCFRSMRTKSIKFEKIRRENPIRVSVPKIVTFDSPLHSAYTAINSRSRLFATKFLIIK